jgi:DNA modification methylase
VSVRILIGDCRERLRELPDQSVHCVVTSPPYFGLRDYGVDGQMGLEATPAEFVEGMVGLFREVRRVLRDDGTLWLNLGDSYTGSGKGGNPEGGRQATNRGSQSVGVLYGKTGESARQAAATNVTRKDFDLGPKQLLGIPWRVAFALQADGWWLRQDIIWSKPNPMPESVRDRCTKAHEYIFMLSKSPRYYYDAEAIKNPASEAMLQQVRDGYGGADTKDYSAGGAQSASGTKARIIEGARKRANKQRGHGRRHAGFNDRWDQMRREEQLALGSNKRSVWTVATQPFSGAHFATYPPALIEPCVLAGCPKGGTVLDPFFGAGTTGLVADRLGRDCIGIELNPEYAAIAERRIQGDAGMFAEVRAA